MPPCWLMSVFDWVFQMNLMLCLRAGAPRTAAVSAVSEAASTTACGHRKTGMPTLTGLAPVGRPASRP